MELIIFTGIQASGKSSFYKEMFSDSHLRINLDMLKTRKRESIILEACLYAKQPVVIDNTNVTKDERQKYILLADKYNFKIVGYYFNSKIIQCLERNEKRKDPISKKGILGTYAKLIIPSLNEGYDELKYVEIKNNKFEVSEWNKG